MPRPLARPVTDPDVVATGAASHAAPDDPAPADLVSLDLETRVGEGGHAALRLWLRLLTCTTLVETDIRSRLRQQFSVTLPRFDLMSQLDRHPEGLKMGELSRRMMVTGGNVTGITDQLQQEGLVSREPLPNDRRAYLIRLTPAGREAFSRMALAHEAWVERLFAGLAEADRDALFRLLGTLKTSLTTP
ncbi:MarR family winged helix-turn-helix transcriptional regulator [Cupriavidus plantarum]|uniref:MarR family winged helix-turn-helix transcriptional regulator n=1 Tax=Cupriavidus plantarum TaxID=942865 RepID=UPI0015C804EA|nr:MarR family transcriptional regulator [Cupriavidus plantarum]NYH98938.1 DNA-binding MarR family transcriptional regulator [Cupriavidus plantarum]